MANNPFKRRSAKRPPVTQKVIERARAYAIEYMRKNPGATPQQLQAAVCGKFKLKIEK